MTYRSGRLSFGPRLVGFVLVWAPPLVLLFFAGRALLQRLDAVLARAAPIAAAEASRALNREVRIGRLGRDFSVRSLLALARQRDALGTLPLAVYDLRVASGPSLATSEPLATAQTATLFVSLPRLLTGDLSTAVRRIVVASPYVLLVRGPQGQLNVEELARELVRRRRGPPGKPFRTTLVVRDGRLTVRDFAAQLPAPQRPAVNWLSGINGTADLTGTRAIGFVFRARALPGTRTAERLTGGLKASGSIARGSPPRAGSARALVSLNVTGALAPYWLDYLTNLRGLTVTAGRADTNLQISLARPDRPGQVVRPQYTGTLQVRGGRVTSDVLWVPLENIAATVRFDPAAARVAATASLLGGPVQASGTIWDLLAPDRQLAVSLQAPRVPLARAMQSLLSRSQRLPPGFTVNGVGALRASIQGTPRDPIITAHAVVSEITFRGIRAQNVTADLGYARGVLTATRVTARVAGGAAEGRAAVQLGSAFPGSLPRPAAADGLRVAFAASVANADLAQIRLPDATPKTLPVSGQANVEAVGKWVGGKLTAAANVIARRADVRGVRVSDARARILVTDNRVLVPDLVALTSAGSARIGGDVSPQGALNLKVNAVGLDIGRIGRVFGQPDLGGLASVRGAIRGTLRAPTFAAQVRVLGPRFRAYRADIASGSVTGTRARVVLGSDVVVRRFPGVVTMSGAISGLGAPRPRLSLTAQVRNVELAEVLQQGGLNLAKLPRVVGVVENATIRVAGTPASPRLSGDVALGDALVGDYAFDGGSLRFDVAGRAVTVARAELRAQGVGTLRASARLAASGQLSGAFAVSDLSLQFLAPLTRRYATIGGSVRIEGALGGTRTRPTLAVRVSSPEVSVAGTPLEDVNADIRLVADTATGNTRVTVPSAGFRQNGTQVRAADTVFESRSGRFATDLSLLTGDLEVLLNTVRRSGLADTPAGAGLVAALNRAPQPISGNFSIETLRVRGRLTQQGLVERDIRAGLRASEVQIGQVRADTLQVSGSLVGDVVRLDEFVVKNDATDTTIIARGQADLNGPIDLVLESSNASLALVNAFAPTQRLEGRVDLTVTAHGQTRTPTVTASLQGRDVSVQGVRLDLLRVPGVVLRPLPGSNGAAEIDISEILLLRGDQSVRVTGTLPFSYASFSLPPGQPIRLQAEAREQSLGLIGVFAPGWADQIRGGMFSARLDVAGTLTRPQLSGFLRVADGRFAPPRSATSNREVFNPIADLDLDLRFDGSVITVRQFEVALGGPNNQRGDFGRLVAGGTVSLAGLESAPRVTSDGLPGTRLARGGSLNLAVSFQDLRPVTEDLLRLGEAARGRVNGDLLVTGSLAEPRIATAGGRPLRISDAFFQTPTRQLVGGGPGRPLPVAVAFDVEAVIDRRAILASANTFRIEADGGFQVQGALTGPNLPTVAGGLRVLGGFFRLPTARFVVQRGGQISLSFRPPADPNIAVSNLVARATVYAPADVRPTLSVRASQGFVPSTTPSATGRSTRYRITAEINGSLLDPNGLDLNPTSDPPLEEAQILALLGSQQQIEQATQGNVQGALKGAFSGVLTNSLLPTLLSPLESGVSSLLGLEEFTLEYNPDAPLSVRFVKRLPDPFERYVISYTRSLGARLAPNEPEPYELRLFYELGTRLQVGASTDEQRETTFFLRGSLSY